MITYIFTLISFLALDGLWILGIARSFYAKQLASIVSTQTNFWPIAIFYPLYTFGIYILVLSPSLKNHSSLGHVFLYGFIFGLCAYGAYDLTNHATIKNWPIMVTLIDMLWGALGTGTASLIGVWLTRLF